MLRRKSKSTLLPTMLTTSLQCVFSRNNVFSTGNLSSSSAFVTHSIPTVHPPTRHLHIPRTRIPAHPTYVIHGFLSRSLELNRDNQQSMSALSSRCLIPANAKRPERQDWKNTPRVSHRGSALYAQNLILPQVPGIPTQRNQWIFLCVSFSFSPRYV